MQYFFFIAALGDLGSLLFYPLMHIFFKPLLMMSLMLYYWQSIDRKLHDMARWILCALFFSWAGDIFLIFDGTFFFIAGLGSFLIAHLLYLGAYMHTQKDFTPMQKRLLAQKPYLVIPFFVYLGVFYSYLFPYLGDLAIPVAIYALVLTCMGVFALNRLGFTTQASFNWILGGAFLFIVSDSILSHALFVWKGSFYYGNFMVMCTYILAQYAIVQGALAHTKNVR